MEKAIRSFTILHNDSDTERIKISLAKTAGQYVWQDENGDSIADEGTVYRTVKSACTAAKQMYNTQAWGMKCTW